MSNLVFVSGDFSSGTTLLFNLFRKTGEFHCLYEPLHEKLLEYLIYPLRTDDQHHPFVGSYFTEYRGFRRVPSLFNPAWGVSGLHLPPAAEADDFYRYWSYLIGTSFGRKGKVLLKENRIQFRLGWLKARFPSCTVLHIYRDKEEQWNSIVRRGQEYFGREDIGQGAVDFAGFNVARWCEDLATEYPELDARNFDSGYQRFAKLWDLSFAEHKRYADCSIDLRDLTRNFEPTCKRIGDCIGSDLDAASLKSLVARSDQRTPASIGASSLGRRVVNAIDTAGRKYARARLRVRALVRGPQ